MQSDLDGQGLEQVRGRFQDASHLRGHDRQPVLVLDAEQKVLGDGEDKVESQFTELG